MKRNQAKFLQIGNTFTTDYFKSSTIFLRKLELRKASGVPGYRVIRSLTRLNNNQELGVVALVIIYCLKLAFIPKVDVKRIWSERVNGEGLKK